MNQLDHLPGEAWGEGFLEQELDRFIQDLRESLADPEQSDGVEERQLSGFGNTTQSLLVLARGAALTDQDLEDAALSLLVYEGRIHVEGGPNEEIYNPIEKSDVRGESVY